MSNNSKILIRCDICDSLVEPQNVKELSYGCGNAFWITNPSMDGCHFACKCCLTKLGWYEASDNSTPENEKPANTPNAAGSSEDNTSKNNITQDSGNAN